MYRPSDSTSICNALILCICQMVKSIHRHWLVAGVHFGPWMTVCCTFFRPKRPVSGGAQGEAPRCERQAAGLQHGRRDLGPLRREPQRQPGLSAVHHLPPTQPQPEDGEHLLQRGNTLLNTPAHTVSHTGVILCRNTWRARTAVRSYYVKHFKYMYCSKVKLKRCKNTRTAAKIKQQEHTHYSEVMLHKNTWMNTSCGKVTLT